MESGQAVRAIITMVRTWKLTGTALWSTLRTQPPENQFTFAKNPPAQGARSRLRHVVPGDVLNCPAAVADEVVMPHACRIEARGPSLGRHLAHQPRLHQIPQIVISGCPGRTRIRPSHGFEDLRSSRMAVLLHQECHHRVALRSAAQPAAVETPLNSLGIHRRIRFCLI